ncbi:MAG: hypothetical protein WAX77_03860 [Methylococcaceae bacterium]
MSTVNTIVRDLSELIKSIQIVLADPIVQTLVETLAELNIQELFIQLVDIVIKTFDYINASIQKLYELLMQGDSAIALLEIVADNLTQFAKGEALTELLSIFEIKDNAFQPVLNATDKVANYLHLGNSVLDKTLPAPQEVKQLHNELMQLQATFQALKKTAVTPALSSTPTNP